MKISLELPIRSKAPLRYSEITKDIDTVDFYPIRPDGHCAIGVFVLGCSTIAI